MKPLNDFLARIRQAIQEFEHGLLWGLPGENQVGDDSSNTGSERLFLAAFVLALLIWAVACLAAGNAGYISAN
jgi:hypothetical protein